MRREPARSTTGSNARSNEWRIVRPSVSIIVPVYEDPVRLERCLERLDQQTYPRERFEVIVADNGSSCNVRQIVSRFTRTRYVCEMKPGSYAARNAGIALADGEILGFTDSDCLPRLDWIDRGVEALTERPNVGLVGGPILLFHRDPQRPTASEFYQDIHGFPQREYVEQKRFSATANMMTRRKVFADVGHFNDKLMSNGDKDWGERVFAAGYEQAYVEDLVVDHPSRYTLRELMQKRMRITGGRVERARLAGEARPGLYQELRRLATVRRWLIDDYADHPMLRTRRQQTVFLGVDLLLQMTDFAEQVRLRCGGSPRRR